MGCDESFASRLRALLRWSEMNFESTFHSGNTLSNNERPFESKRDDLLIWTVLG